MIFTPEVHAINLRGTKKPIVSSTAKKIGAALKNQLHEKLNFLNAGNFGTLADA